MDIAIRCRNTNVSDVLRLTAEEKVARLGRYVDGMERAEVRFSEERNPRIADREVCEVIIVGHGHTVRAKAAAADNFAAVDRVVDKLEHRLEKLKGRLVRHSNRRRHPSNGAVLQGASTLGTDLPTDDSDDDVEPGPRIVRTKQFAMKPMTPEEAVLQMDMLSHDFYFFTNSESNRAAVVYRRRDGDFGLIDAT